MKILKYILIPIAAAIFSCSSESDPAPPEVILTTIDANTSIDENTGTMYITDLPGSVGNTYATGHIPVFFSLSEHAIINPYNNENQLQELPDSLKTSTLWDLGFTEIYNSSIIINNGNIAGNPGENGPGIGKIIVIDALFDEVDAAPTDQEFDEFMKNQTATGWENYPPGSKGWYFYSLESHIMSPISGVTIIIKTAEGKYAKVEMGSIYLGSPENPTVNTPSPYFNFRYFLQTDGSRNLKTRN